MHDLLNKLIENHMKISLKLKISHFQLTSEPPELPAGDQRTWILEVDCFPLLRPGNVERSVTGGAVSYTHLPLPTKRIV